MTNVELMMPTVKHIKVINLVTQVNNILHFTDMQISRLIIKINHHKLNKIQKINPEICYQNWNSDMIKSTRLLTYAMF
jgi:hypothetical protein